MARHFDVGYSDLSRLQWGNDVYLEECIPGAEKELKELLDGGKYAETRCLRALVKYVRAKISDGQNTCSSMFLSRDGHEGFENDRPLYSQLSEEEQFRQIQNMQAMAKGQDKQPETDKSYLRKRLLPLLEADLRFDQNYNSFVDDGKVNIPEYSRIKQSQLAPKKRTLPLLGNDLLINIEERHELRGQVYDLNEDVVRLRSKLMQQNDQSEQLKRQRNTNQFLKEKLAEKDKEIMAARLRFREERRKLEQQFENVQTQIEKKLEELEDKFKTKTEDLKKIVEEQNLNGEREKSNQVGLERLKDEIMLARETQREANAKSFADTQVRIENTETERNQPDLIQENTYNTGRIKDLEDTIKRQEEEIKTLKDAQGRVCIKENELQTKLQELILNNKRISSELENALKREKELEENIQDVQSILEARSKEMDQMKATNDNLKREIQHLTKANTRPLLTRHLNQELDEAKKQLRRVQQELEDTKSRLSRAMGDKLTDNNPSIADLSDKNRPTKISERYQELYDNQWTDAFEVVEKIHRSEKEAIAVLKNILMYTSAYCKREAAKQMANIKDAFLKGNELPSNMHKAVKDCRKSLAEAYGRELYKEYIKQVETSHAVTRKIPQFVKECFEICWLMAVQDPPVVLGEDLPENAFFNKDLYKAYTRSGDQVEYVVWPVLLLHQDGPVLCKGIAQGYLKVDARSLLEQQPRQRGLDKGFLPPITGLNTTKSPPCSQPRTSASATALGYDPSRKRQLYESD